MLLKKVTIHKYKSFLTEQSYTVEDHITALLAKMNPEKLHCSKRWQSQIILRIM